MRQSVVFAAAFALWPAVPALAQAQTGDLWEITMKVEMAGMPPMAGMPAQKVCSPRSREEPPFRGGREDCRITEQKSTGNGWTWKMACNDGTTGAGNIAYEGTEAWKGTMQMQIKGQGEMKTSMSSKRVGACDYKPPAGQAAPKK